MSGKYPLDLIRQYCAMDIIVEESSIAWKEDGEFNDKYATAYKAIPIFIQEQLNAELENKIRAAREQFSSVLFPAIKKEYDAKLIKNSSDEINAVAEIENANKKRFNSVREAMHSYLMHISPDFLDKLTELHQKLTNV